MFAVARTGAIGASAPEDGQAGFGSVDLGHGDGPVHLDAQGAGLLGERLVQRGDRPPVAGLMQVPVGDGRLEQGGTEGTVLAVFEMGGLRAHGGRLAAAAGISVQLC